MNPFNENNARSEIMSKIKSKNTKIEVLLKKCLKGTHIRFQPKILGRPDFGLANKKIAIFVDGCFWHKCPRCFRAPKSNKAYWESKIKRNVSRDKAITLELKDKGWKVMRFWEHEILSNPKSVTEKIKWCLN
ncbi:MAG: very short patch repair endonuclease [Candidatus Nanoarchaeia archaeon]|jgi:DNA mismatch endonuclease (patch repair protein)